MTRLAVVLVHYQTPELAAAALEALRADVAAAGIDAEWLLVDNGSDAAGRKLLSRLPVERLDPGRNLGYAGGVNLGVARSKAERILLLNPDVLVLPGCLPALLAALDRGAAVAGPRFWWDRGRRMLLPPAEVRTRRAELAAALARREEAWARPARRRWRKHARSHWLAREPLPSWALSGSLLALTREAWEAVGPFDEGYPLYFEETDWLRRAESRGLSAVYVPAAEAVHLHAQSAVQEPRVRQWFEESARRFRRRHYGPAFTRLLERLGGIEKAPPLLPVAGRKLELPPHPGPLWVELSPNPTGFPAAAEPLPAGATTWSLPAEVEERLPAGRWVLQVVDEEGRELARRSLPVGEET